MSIELIICLVAWVVITEFIFFNSSKYESFDSFIETKLFSMAISTVLVFFSFGLPAIIATGLGDVEAAVGYMAYVWYYATISAIVAFIGINYLIYRKVNKK